MKLSVLIINWNVRELLAECLHSLEQYQGPWPMEVIVVDSASSDGSAEMIAEKFPWAKLLAQAENIGFVRGNNLALAAAQGEYLFLLNPDTRLHPQALSRMLDYLEAHPAVGILGPHTLNTDGTHQSTRRRFPTLWTALIDSTWLQTKVPPRAFDHFYVRDLPDGGSYPVDWVQGSALLARRAVYEQIGGLDTRYVMFFEELDWCKRAKAAGWEVVYLGEAFLTHHGGASTGQVSTRKHQHYQASKLAYFHKFHGLPAALFLWGALLLSYSLEILEEGAKLALGSKAELRRERIRAYGALLRTLLRWPFSRYTEDK
jgi:GT2 family glycosyltransferase